MWHITYEKILKSARGYAAGISTGHRTACMYKIRETHSKDAT